MLASVASISVYAQEPFGVDQCIAYAVGHSLDVSRSEIGLADAVANRSEAIGAFMPSLSASVGAQLNYGRAVDPQTNVYTNVNTFNNQYSLEAYVSVFEGLRKAYALRLTKAQMLMGREGVRAAKDEAAMRTFVAYIDAVFCSGMLDMAQQKRDASALLLREVEVLESVGRKSQADVLQIRATLAADEYELTRREGLVEQSVLALKRIMNYPLDDALVLDTTVATAYVSASSPSDVFHVARMNNPLLLRAEYGAEVARSNVGMSRSAFMPRLAVGAGVSSSYFKASGSSDVPSFSSQMSNNVGKAVYAQLSIPLFSRLSSRASVRRSQNALRQANEEVTRQEQELQSIVAQTIIERNNAEAQLAQMLTRSQADSLALHVTTRRFQEGQASAIDVRQQSAQWLESRSLLLQCRLTLALKQRMIDYYNGKPLYNE